MLKPLIVLVFSAAILFGQDSFEEAVNGTSFLCTALQHNIDALAKYEEITQWDYMLLSDNLFIILSRFFTSVSKEEKWNKEKSKMMKSVADQIKQATESLQGLKKKIKAPKPRQQIARGFSYGQSHTNLRIIRMITNCYE